MQKSLQNSDSRKEISEISNKKQRLFLFFIEVKFDIDASLETVKQKSGNKEAVVTAKTAPQLVAKHMNIFIFC